jgi:hydrogenase nickel incorporation protein HypA/HybF
MHEVGLMKSILEIAVAEASRVGAARVGLIRVRAGTLSGVVPAALEFAFDAMRGENPVTAGARLQIDPVAAACRCRNCGAGFTPADFVFACPRCRSLDAEILRGRELELSQLEVN